MSEQTAPEGEGSQAEQGDFHIALIPECKGQAVCTNGRRCLDAGECLRPYQCQRCLRSTAREDHLCASCAVQECCS